MNRFNFLQAALKTIEGPRDEVYGSAEENHQRIAAAWSNILKTEVTIPQVYACMIAVKLGWTLRPTPRWLVRPCRTRSGPGNLQSEEGNVAAVPLVPAKNGVDSADGVTRPDACQDHCRGP